MMDEYDNPEPLKKRKQYQPPKSVSQEHQEFLKRVGVKLKLLRETKGFSILKLSTELGISRNKYHLMEQGQIYFNMLSLVQILDFFNITPEDFFKDL